MHSSTVWPSLSWLFLSIVFQCMNVPDYVIFCTENFMIITADFHFNICNEMGMVIEFTYLGDKINAGGARDVAATAETNFECLVYGMW